MKTKDAVTPRQLTALAFVSVFSPLIRRFPRTLAATGGRSSWIAIPMAALFLIPIFLLMCLLLRSRPGASFSALLTDALGVFLGRVVTALYALWLLFYTGFLLESGAIRFLSTVYQGAHPWIFILCMALACAAGAAGPVRAIARSAMLLRPLMAAIPALIVLLTLKDADVRLLLPVIAADLMPDAFAALKVVNLLGVAFYLSFFGERVEGPFRLRNSVGWAAALLALVGLMTLGCLSMFGPELTAKMTYPFFMLARDVTVLGALERIEPVIIAVWVFADFIFLSVLLRVAAQTLRFSLSGDNAPPRWLPPLCALCAAGTAFLLPENLTGFYRISEFVVPIVSASMVFGVPLLTLIAGKLRKKW